MIDEPPSEQANLYPPRVHSEARITIREMLANRGTMPSSEIARALRITPKQVATKLAAMEEARMIRRIGRRAISAHHRETVWALRCWKEPVR